MGRRTERINHLLREEISDLLRRNVNDPRLGGFITVTRVSTSSDLSQAKVFVSILGSEDEKQEALKTLTSASSFFLRELRRRLSMRYIPELNFCRDDTIEQGAHVLELIELSEGEQESETT